jgi:ketol-acid reductoisomerase
MARIEPPPAEHGGGIRQAPEGSDTLARGKEGHMTTIYREQDADPERLRGQRVAVVGYGNQGRSWALNLRDSGADVTVCVRADATREQALGDGFRPRIARREQADILCVLVPTTDPELGLAPRASALTVVASGYSLAFGRFDPPGDVGMVAPRMLGPEVRRCFEEGVGFISAVGVHRDVSGEALARTLAVARGIGGLAQGALALTPKQEAVLDLAVEQVLSPALTHVNQTFVATMLAQGIPLEAVMTELILSGEVERSYRLLREVGYAGQFGFHSPTSQYGQLSRRSAYEHLDVASTMKKLTDDIASGRFADEWDAESRAGHPKLRELRERFAGAAVREFEQAIRRQLGPTRDAATGNE